MHAKSKKKKNRLFFWLAILFPFLVTAILAVCFTSFVDLKPKVDENFFFSSDDPQFKADKIISDIFPQPPQLIMAVKGDLQSEEYFAKVKELSDELVALPEVFAVQSLTHGPDDLDDAIESPLWKRVLISEKNDASFISVFVKDIPAEIFVPKIEKIRDEFQSADFELMISGAPYIIEHIRRNLLRDLKIFSSAAFVVFGVMLFIFFHSKRVLLGMLVACIDASMLTLLLVQVCGIPIGPLTANLSTIVFVMTLSHMVFMTFNWKDLVSQKPEKENGELVKEAASITFNASFWSMATTLLGFISLLFVQATPLKQLGVSGAIGTLVSMAAAYFLYPPFLKWGNHEKREKKSSQSPFWISLMQGFFTKRHSLIVLFFVLAAAVFSKELGNINTDPSVFVYFQKGSELRSGLEYIDQNGGSNPLKIVIADKKGAKFNTSESYRKMWKLHEALERDPMVGSAVSLPVILAEAKRSPFTLFLKTEWLLKMMESPKFGEIAQYFVTEDRMKTLFVLRMKETGRKMSRLEVVDKIKKIVEKRGFIPELTGGVYLLQGKLSELLTSSLVSGLVMLIAMFVFMGWMLSRSFQISMAMLIGLTIIPLCMLGLIGYLRVPLDIICAPAANIAIAMGVDAMIHILFFVKRVSKGKMTNWDVWSEACKTLWQPVVCSATVVSAGFTLFMLSVFPPTQRFGFSVLLGTIISFLSALIVLPWFASLRLRKENKSN